jgi:hypothetical protein
MSRPIRALHPAPAKKLNPSKLWASTHSATTSTTSLNRATAIDPLPALDPPAHRPSTQKWLVDRECLSRHFRLPSPPPRCLAGANWASRNATDAHPHDDDADHPPSKKHQKRLSAPSHWLLDKLSGTYAPRPSPGPHKLRECMPLIIFIRNRLKYALNYRETRAIVMQRLIKVDHKVRTDMTYPTGFMDVITIEKTGENFRLIYDTKGRFTVHRIGKEEAEYKLGKVKRVQLGRGGIPFLVTHDART